MYPIRTCTWNLTLKKCENDRVSCSVLNLIVQNDNRLHAPYIFVVVFSKCTMHKINRLFQGGWVNKLPI